MQLFPSGGNVAVVGLPHSQYLHLEGSLKPETCNVHVAEKTNRVFVQLKLLCSSGSSVSCSVYITFSTCLPADVLHPTGFLLGTIMVALWIQVSYLT
ncbi:hypothetical protein BaRGS_00032489 [Batillaria attramentaria]|uniref:Uncharacterized protein n=1 Tax=Batillaria attramentaria TaxID=370345 RepID=A0ABD0JNK2_9CAEN